LGRLRGYCGLLGGESGVDRERDRGDVAGFVGNQPGDRVADVYGFDE
jgi:hypothetical protein